MKRYLALGALGAVLIIIGLAAAHAFAGGTSAPTIVTRVVHAPPRTVVVHVQHRVVVVRTQTVTAPNPTVAPPAPASAVSTPVTPGLRSCDQNISANVVTSCIFAKNVFVAYYVGYENNGQQQPTSVVAYSPVARISYNENCYSDGTTVNCSNGSNFVTFPLWAIQVYAPR